ncbi:MAG TPA: hypothetical protein VFR49_02370, partial [Solirubrobacteraceae bacterium]|nr:hypothetical protein [Solirubrobacteraceae bacterium]
EKIKPEKEHKLEIKEIKETKLEVKEKIEKPEKEKHDGKEFKAELEKHPKLEKEKHDAKEIKVELEKHPKVEFEKLPKEAEKPIVEKGGKEVAEGDPATHGGDPAAGLDTATLLAHADALVASGQQLRHFIEQSQRPDLTGGALTNEADLQGNADGSA